MGRCVACGTASEVVSDSLGTCGSCLRDRNPEALSAAAEAHREGRTAFGLPLRAPSNRIGVPCGMCVRSCRIGEGEHGYCGVRVNRGGKLIGGDEKSANVSFYYDALPTNCVASWVCPAGTDCGYPEFSLRKGPEVGFVNLAVFYEACSFDCLFCQNWHYRQSAASEGGLSAQTLAEAVDGRTACVCFFGGDPGPQARHALAAATIARKKAPGRPLRICWETNGSEDPTILDEMVDLSLESGGCVKFDLKAFSAPLHEGLCGIGNRRTLSNFRRAARRIAERPDPPLLVASTLLVPGYVDGDEAAAIARFIAGLDPAIPFSLLGFHPDFLMSDLPCTSVRHAREAEEAAREAGLTRVRIGNRFMLGNAEY